MNAVETLKIEGLREPVEVLLDHWGIPHVFAGNDHDLYFAQGFTTARYRLWQMDMWRKRGLGLLSATFGKAFVGQDRARRHLLYHGDMKQEWAAYGPGVHETCEAFVAGINAWVDRTRHDPALLPSEFGWTSDVPALWQADDIVRIRSVGLRMNVADEVARCRLAEAGALSLDRVRRALDPERPLEVPEGLDPAMVPADSLRMYAMAMAELDLANADPDNLQPLAGSTASNVWAIAPARTSTGRPIFANDPHRTQVTPSVRWLIHLNAPGIAAIGATEPVHPGVSNGHNGKLAFGFTYSPCDQEDLYVYETDPSDPTRYRYAGQWETMRLIEESIPVRGQEAERVVLAFTRHGPVLHQDRVSNRCVAIRSTFLAPGGAPYFAGVHYHRATNLADFEQRLEHASAPTMNYCAADTAGSIGLFVRGRVPVRKGWDGLLPVPGDGRYEWAGSVPPAAMPTVRDPSLGWVASCNQAQMPDDYPYQEHRIGFEFSDPTRYRRLTALMAAQPKISMADACRFQTDQTLLLPTHLIPDLLRHMPGLPQRIAAGLQDWDGRMHADDAIAAFVAVWLEAHLRPALVAHRVPSEVVKVVGLGDWRALLEAPVAPEILRRTAQSALEDLRRRLGDDDSRWQLGAVQTMTIRHPLSHALGAAQALDIGPVAVGGHANTLNKADSLSTELAVKHGPSFRIVIDVGDWDRSRAINMPGQSGDPRDPHYRDMVEGWQAGSYVPLLWTRQGIEAELVGTWRLEPASTTSASGEAVRGR